MVSLLHLAEVTEEGVQFQSPVDGACMMLTPEHSIAVQNRLGLPPSLRTPLSAPALSFGSFVGAVLWLMWDMHSCCVCLHECHMMKHVGAGADIIMALDDVVSSVNTTPERLVADMFQGSKVPTHIAYI